MSLLLDQHDVPNDFDCLSIDAEGWEFALLQGFSLRRRRMKLLTIEYNFEAQRRRTYDSLPCPAG